MGYIYEIKNKINNKIYIGQTIKSPSQTKNYLGSGKYIKRALEEYGRENFTKRVIEEWDTKEQLNEREMFWIDALNTKEPYGYNVMNGGGSSAPVAEGY